MQTTATRPKVTVTADGTGVVSHAGSRLLADLADRSSLTAELSEALVGVRRPRAVHDPGRVLVDLAVAVADGAEAISDITVLADQGELFGEVGQSRSVPWERRDEASRLLAELKRPDRAWTAVVGEGTRCWFGNQFSLIAPRFIPRTGSSCGCRSLAGGSSHATRRTRC